MAEKEYIEREALLEDIEKSVVISTRSEDKANAELRGVRKILDRIKSAPTADVVEVVHGEWIKKYCWEEDYVCSVCGELAHKNAYGICAEFTNYCPNCGAKMDGKGDV